MPTRLVVVALACLLFIAHHARAQTTPPAAAQPPSVQPPPPAPSPAAPAPVAPAPVAPAQPAPAQPAPAVPAPSQAAPAQPPQVAPAPPIPVQPQATPPAATRPANRTAEETLRQMLQPQGESARPLRPVQPEQPPAVDATSGPGAVAPGGAPQPLLREGTLLLDRVGRLTRSEDGRTLEFTLDADGRGMADAPLVLLPNRRLAELEGHVQGSYRDPKIRVSGEVMEYRGRNYLLLQRWSAVPDVVQPLQ